MRAYQYRFYPTAAQRLLLDRYFGTARWAWNHALERRSKAYRRRKESITGIDVSRAITQLKKTSRYAWIKLTPATVVVQRLRDQDTAFQNFFAGRHLAAKAARLARAQRVVARRKKGPKATSSEESQAMPEVQERRLRIRKLVAPDTGVVAMACGTDSGAGPADLRGRTWSGDTEHASG